MAKIKVNQYVSFYNKGKLMDFPTGEYTIEDELLNHWFFQGLLDCKRIERINIVNVAKIEEVEHIDVENKEKQDINRDELLANIDKLNLRQLKDICDKLKLTYTDESTKKVLVQLIKQNI